MVNQSAFRYEAFTAQTTFKWAHNGFVSYKSIDWFPLSFWPLQFGFIYKMSMVFNLVMKVETLASFEILVAKITFDTLMPFQFSLFHEF